MLAPVLTLAQVQAASRPRALYVAGVDVVQSVSRDSVEVIEAGMGGVSSMTFTIDDPSVSFVITDGMDVRFVDNTNDVPTFVGWVQAWSYVPDFGNQGRRIVVTAIGPESILDWTIVTAALTFTAGQAISMAGMAQSIAANSSGSGPLRVFNEPVVGLSSQATPTGGTNSLGPNVDVTIAAGTTLREAITKAATATLSATGAKWQIVVTVDMYYGLRMWLGSGAFFGWSAGFIPSDWTNMTILDSAAFTNVSENLSHDVTAAEVVRQVYVAGANAAASGLFSAGTGLPGPTASVSDTTITTAAQAAAFAADYLQRFSAGVRGTFERQTFTPTLTVHAASAVIITDVRTGMSAYDVPIMQIRKTFYANSETWEIAYGGRTPSVADSLRRLTRTTLS